MGEILRNEKGVFIKGPGRTPGSKNKRTREIQEVIDYMLSALKDGDLDDMLATLKREKPEAVLGFLGKIAPKQQTVRNETIGENPIAKEIRELRHAVQPETTPDATSTAT